MSGAYKVHLVIYPCSHTLILCLCISSCTWVHLSCISLACTSKPESTQKNKTNKHRGKIYKCCMKRLKICQTSLHFLCNKFASHVNEHLNIFMMLSSTASHYSNSVSLFGWEESGCPIWCNALHAADRSASQAHSVYYVSQWNVTFSPLIRLNHLALWDYIMLYKLFQHQRFVWLCSGLTSHLTLTQMERDDITVSLTWFLWCMSIF